MTKKQFALWSFERDRTVGLYDLTMNWNTLGKKEQDIYLEEANHYLRLKKEQWPCGILIREGTHTQVHPYCTDQNPLA